MCIVLALLTVTNTASELSFLCKLDLVYVIRVISVAGPTV